MSHAIADVAFTPAVQALQQQHGSRAQYARMQARPDSHHMLGPEEVDYLANADSFYMATVSETGWPYVQHRGGPRGFLKVLSPTELAFADFPGNLQYITAGNATQNDKASIIVMDYVHQRRLKLLGRLRFVPAGEADENVLRKVELSGYSARVERVALIEVVGFDWNCPQHITQRFTAAEVEAASLPLRQRVAELEAKLRAAS